MIPRCLVLFLFLFLSAAEAAPPGWRAGAARVDLTPEYAVRLSGYGSRTTEFEGVEQHVFAKALALSAGDGPVAVIVTVDNCAVPGVVRDEVVRRLGGAVADERFAVCSSHTHCAPMLGGALGCLFGADIPPEEAARIERYTREVTDKLEQVARAALEARAPCELSWAQGEVAFAGNRRLQTPAGFTNSQNVGGPVDHALPVLRVTGADGKVRAVLTGYACHCTTLHFNRVHGDWAGCAQEAMEAAFPGAIALTALGCGGDQNPYPRGTVELAQQHGSALAEEAVRLVRGAMPPLPVALECRRRHLALPFDTLPARAEWERRATDPKGGAIGYHARRNLARLDRGEKLPESLDYSVQVWRFGEALTIVFLCGEVVVDYSLRLKRELDGARLWVAAYANDVPCYIPSRRVLEEGGYEAASAMTYYDRPAKFAPQVEELIIQAVHEAMK